MNTDRRMVMRMNPDILLGLGKEDGITTVGAPVPQDARVVNRMIDERGDVLLLVESETFPETCEGGMYPSMYGITFRRMDLEDRCEMPWTQRQIDALCAFYGGKFVPTYRNRMGTIHEADR